MVVIRYITVHEDQRGQGTSSAVCVITVCVCASSPAREVGLLGEQGSKENNLTHFTEGFMKIERFAQCHFLSGPRTHHVHCMTCAVCDMCSA